MLILRETLAHRKFLKENILKFDARTFSAAPSQRQGVEKIGCKVFPFSHTCTEVASVCKRENLASNTPNANMA